MKLYHELAEYYFAIEKNHRDIHHDVSFIQKLLGVEKNPSLLDLGCGTGEHLDLLHRAGVRCTGIDISEKMLSIARARFSHGIEFIRMDMTDMDYQEEFDIIISLFGSFNYLIQDSDIESMLRKTYRALKPGGVGVFEIWNASPLMKIKKKDIDHTSTTKYKGAIIKRERGFKLWDKSAKTIVEVGYRYTLKRRLDQQVLRDRHIMRAFTRDQFTAALVRTGFLVEAFYSNFLFQPFEEDSARMVVVFKR